MQKKWLKTKDYTKLLLAVFISSFGDVLFDLFIVWKVTIDSQNIMNAAYILGSSIAFRGILSLGIGMIIDKYNKKRLIVYSNIISAMIITTFAISYKFVIKHIVLGIAFILINDICNTIYFNTYTVIASEKFEKEKFISFQAISAMGTRCINILGASLVGAMMNYLADRYIFMIDIATFLLSALLISKISYVYVREAKQNLRSSFKIPFLYEIKTAFQYIWENAIIRNIVIVIFLLNLAYGFIPNILPLMLSGETGDSMLLGNIKAMLALGEIIGLAIAKQYGKYVSRLFKMAMICCGVCMLSLIVVDNCFSVVIFLLYGVFDAITQPMFSYMITNIDEKNRGKIIGGIDTILLLSPSLGIAIGTKLIRINYICGFIYLAAIFASGYLIVILNKNLNNIKV